MKNKIIAFALIAGTFGLFSAGLVLRQVPDIIPDLKGKLEDYYRRYPQQKAYLHLDKLAYQAGEKIWYMAYLVDARSHKPDTISENLLVEIVNSYGEVQMIQLLHLKKGFAEGDFSIPDTLREGLYQIRAYTNWMRNFGSDYFFKRDFNIWNPENYLNLYREDKIASKKHKKQSTRKSRKLDVQFFPEGGYMVGGIPSKLGFKAINELGLGVPVSGKILEKKGSLVAEFSSSHLGMGSFVLTPETGKKYLAEIETDDGKKLHYDLPVVQASGYYMKLLEKDRNGLRLQVGSTINGSAVLIACHIRGKLLFTSGLQLGSEDIFVDIPTVDFPGGVMQITLFDNNRVARCERLVYIHSDDLLNLSIRQEKTEYEKKEAVELTLTAKDGSGRPVEGRFSISVADRDLENNAADFQSGIVSSLLLSTELKGRIEQPDFYFRNQEAETLQALDNLLLTQGWRRFDWNDVINENTRTINHPIQNGIGVSGKITKEFLDLPLKNLPVTLTVLSEFNDVFVTRTDNKGKYKFELPDYEDTIQVEITARRPSGRKNLVIHVDDNEVEKTEIIYSSYASEMVVKGTNVLKPVEEREVDSMQQTLEGIYHSPDHVLYIDDNMRSSYGSVLDMMKGRVPGVDITGNDVLIRGPSSLYGSNQPLFLIDNVPVDVEAVQSLSTHDIERIEVLKGPSSAIYGIRGGNGVIAIFTKRGRFLIKGILTFDLLAYHRPREFYSPKYGTDFDDLVIDTRSSLYWNPELKTDGTGTARIRYYNSNKTSSFYIVVEGISKDGKIGRTEKSYTVK